MRQKGYVGVWRRKSDSTKTLLWTTVKIHTFFFFWIETSEGIIELLTSLEHGEWDRTTQHNFFNNKSLFGSLSISLVMERQSWIICFHQIIIPGGLGKTYSSVLLHRIQNVLIYKHLMMLCNIFHKWNVYNIMIPY